MSLLSKKSWNPRSSKNRARVERDERELAEEERQKRKRTQEIETEYHSERLRKDAKKQKPARGPELGDHAWPPPKANATKPHPPVSTWGSVTKGLIPWYARNNSEDARPIDARLRKVYARDNVRDDPFTLMESKEAEANKSKDRSTRSKKDAPTASSPDRDRLQMEPAKTQIEKLREERLRREKEEREKANRLLTTSRREENP
ncbi:leukocyte receptor cluster member 1 homolog [Schistocerca gregaria]|uniref:leukocyte receptor cluster member 1 homolog n=1 Tax=Schistocerca gregaria TaxID=7010 RepID=UPI00211F0B12|nr:leukocyte receptor cluster member 1 homolog [Schistocerca gregaria]